MGWLDTKESRRNQHLQMIATGNIRDIDRIQQRERKRRWFIFLDVVLVACIIIGIIFTYYDNNYKTGIIFLVIGLVIFLYLVLRKSLRKKRNFQKRRNFRRK